VDDKTQDDNLNHNPKTIQDLKHELLFQVDSKINLSNVPEEQYILNILSIDSKRGDDNESSNSSHISPNISI
jgi:hypothetical protein